MMEKMEEIKRNIRTKLLTLSDKILEVDEFKEALLTQVNDECEYWFDEYPRIYSYELLETGYISLEEGIDEMICSKYYIKVKMKRIFLEIQKDYIIVLEVGETSVEEREEDQ